jgi:hypothetical protein
MQNAQFIIMQLSAAAFHHIVEIRTQQDAVPSASTVVIVLLNLLASISTAVIHVLEFVVQTLSVLLQTTFQYVVAIEDLMEILLVDVEKINQLMFLLRYLQIPANLQHAVQIHYVALLMEGLHVLV